MLNSRTSLVALVLVCAPLCGIAGDAPKSSDQTDLQGIWLARSESQNGHERSVTYQYVFKGNTLTFTDETGKAMKYSFELDTTSNPRLITIRPEDTADNST